MTVKRALLVYGVVFLLALPLTFPVRLLAGLVTLPSGVASAPVKGSLWSVRLDWVRVGAIQVRDLRVRPSIFGWFHGAPLKLSLSEPFAVEANVGSREDGATLRELLASTRLEVLRDLLKIPPLGFDALITLTVDEAAIAGDNCQQLAGELVLSAFEGNIDGVSQLSPITGNLSCEGGRIILSVNPDNSLRLSGNAVFSATGHYQLNMTAEPPPGPVFETFVDLLGQPRDGKRFQLNFRS